MNIQIFGTSKSFDTKKAKRYFKERKIPFQYIDLKEKNLSKGELQSVIQVIGVNALIDEKSTDYIRLSLNRIVSANMREELLLKHTGLYKTPIVRNGAKATVGYAPDSWDTWVNFV